MKIKIEKEVKWDASNCSSYDRYYIWVNSDVVASAGTEEEAKTKYEAIKANYRPIKSEIILEEEI
jgi:hypothetical protein